MARKLRFSNRLREMRLQRGWSPEHVAASVQISGRQYFRIEVGESEPGAHNLRKLAKLFGCSMEELFDDRAG